MITVNQLSDGLHLIGQFLVKDVTKGMTAKGLGYLSLILGDATGEVDAKVWSYTDADLDVYVKGNIVQVEADAILYRDKIQLKIYSAEKISREDIDFTRFIASAPRPQKEMEEELSRFLSSIRDEEIKAIVSALIERHKDAYFVWPAAVRVHHNYVSGLLYHSLHLAELAEGACKIYPSLNRDILIGACLIHDLGKTIELSGPIATEYTFQGRLLGHISILQAEVREEAKKLGYEGSEKAVLLEHMVLSHHGKPEFGSAVMPLTREAVALNMIDDFDAKMACLDNAFQGVNPGEWSPKIFAMDDRYFYLPTDAKKE